MTDWKTLPEETIIQNTAEALTRNGFTAIVVENGEEAKRKVLEMIPEGGEVLANTSITLEQTGILDVIDNSGKYNSVRKKILSLDRQKDADQIRALRSVQEYALGSVHAITYDGRIVIASNSGSQIPGEVYGAKHVFFVVGAQKIVANVQEAEKRITEYVAPLESIRARKAYGLPDTWNTYSSKVLYFNREVVPNRVNVILVKEVLGY